MSNKALIARFANKIHAANEWQKFNPILENGEIGIEGDKLRFKIGDGIHTWNELEFVKGSAASEELIAGVGIRIQNQEISALLGYESAS